jgi:hypothetical protein
MFFRVDGGRFRISGNTSQGGIVDVFYVDVRCPALSGHCSYTSGNASRGATTVHTTVTTNVVSMTFFSAKFEYNCIKTATGNRSDTKVIYNTQES